MKTTRPMLLGQKVGLIFLILIITGFWVYVHWIESGPFYAHYYDPELAYLMSSLSVYQGHSYVYIDHPGTPVEVLGSALLALTYPVTRASSGSFIMYHLKHPELFITLSHVLLTLASILCVVLLVRHAIKVEHWTDALFSIAVAAFFYAVHPMAFRSLVFWSHNSFNFPAGCLLLLALLNMMRSERRLRWWQVSALGFGAGVLAAVQIYFVTWIVGIAIAVAALCLLKKRGWLNTILACFNVGLASLLGFLAATLPILKQYPRLFQWMERLLFHQERYGKGAPGITSPEQFLEHFLQLLENLQVLFVATSVVVVMLVMAMFLKRRKSGKDLGLWAVAWGLSVQLVVTVVIIIKHPKVSYMMAAAVILTILLAVAYTLLRSYGPSLRLLYVGISVAVLIGLFYNLINSGIDQRALVSRLHSAEKEMERYFTVYAAATKQDRDSLKILWTYGTDSHCYALWFGNNYADHAFSEEIFQIFPHQGQLDIWRQKVLLPDGWVPSDSVVDWDIIVTAQKILENHPYLAAYGKAVTSQAKTAYFGNIVFITRGSR